MRRGEMVYGVLHKLRHPRHSLRADSLTHISRPYIPSLLIGSLPTPIWTRPFMSPLSWAPRIYSLSLTCACVCVCICAVTSISPFSFGAFYYSPLIRPFFLFLSSSSVPSILYLLVSLLFLPLSQTHGHCPNCWALPSPLFPCSRQAHTVCI